MMRIGFGYDVHPMVKDRKLILGGIHIPYEKGLLGHSDADALCHAVGDALLGAVALGDIGQHFPDDDPQYAGISSLLLLKKISLLLGEKRVKINNVDATIVLEQPRLRNFIDEMRKNIAEALSLPVERISIKATTSEKMGFVGEKKGIAVYACALVEEEHIDEKER